MYLIFFCFFCVFYFLFVCIILNGYNLVINFNFIFDMNSSKKIYKKVKNIHFKNKDNIDE